MAYTRMDVCRYELDSLLSEAEWKKVSYPEIQEEKHKAAEHWLHFPKFIQVKETFDGGVEAVDGAPPFGEYRRVHPDQPILRKDLQKRIAKAIFSKGIFSFWVLKNPQAGKLEKWVSLYLPDESLDGWEGVKSNKRPPSIEELAEGLQSKIAGNSPKVEIEGIRLPEVWLELYRSIPGTRRNPEFLELLFTLSEQYGLLSSKSS